ncbi:hypothetical protein ZWY2020_054727 [Hordeum vulgare]|nr:hypothetical protein ZWY2020_054727 [Hordeum vulgare]
MWGRAARRQGQRRCGEPVRRPGHGSVWRLEWHGRRIVENVAMRRCGWWSARAEPTHGAAGVPPAYYARLASFRARFYIEPDSSDSGSIMSALQSGSSTSRRRRGRQAPPYALGQLEESRVLLLMMMLESPVLLQNKKDSVLFAAGRIR